MLLGSTGRWSPGRGTRESALDESSGGHAVANDVRGRRLRHLDGHAQRAAQGAAGNGHAEAGRSDAARLDVDQVAAHLWPPPSVPSGADLAGVVCAVVVTNVPYVTDALR